MNEDKKIPRGQTAERRAYMKQYVATHPKRDRRAYKKAYDEAHKEQSAAYRISKGDDLKTKKRDYYKSNRERLLANVKKRSIEKRADILEYHRKHYEKNSDRIKKNVEAYRIANPDKKKHLENKRRARKFKNGGSHTLQQRLEKFESLGNVCFYCKKERKLTIDHDLPLSRGGTDDIKNILPCCRPCNSKKHNMTSEEFIKRVVNNWGL